MKHKEVIKHKATKRMAKQENIFFLIAIFALLLAGDMLWWESRQIGDDIENSAALVKSMTVRGFQDVDSFEEEIKAAEQEGELELKILEATVTE